MDSDVFFAPKTTVSPRFWFRLCLTSIISVLFVPWFLLVWKKPTWGVPAFFGWNEGLLGNHGHGIFSFSAEVILSNQCCPINLTCTGDEDGCSQTICTSNFELFQAPGPLFCTIGAYWKFRGVSDFRKKPPLTKQWYSHKFDTDSAIQFKQILPGSLTAKAPCKFTKGPKKARFALSSLGRRVKMPRVLIHASPISPVDATTSLCVLGSKTPVVSHFGDKLINPIP